ncbi:MAG: twin-arginine translocase subunit TatC [Thermoleophilaceae bacterium]
MARLKSVRHDEELSLVDHLDELRSRLIVVVIAFGVAFAACFWQNHYVLAALNRPLDGLIPVTLGVAEQFTTTLTVAAYAAILVIMPVFLFQAYAFLLPAFSPGERKVALPLLLMVPVLFIGGVVFGYFVVLPNAISFLLAFNSDEFNVMLRARDYYSFTALTLVAIGILFQIPVGILAVTRLGIITPRQLRKNRRYAFLGIAVVAMLLPGTDPVTMLLSMAPLVVLFELSVLMASAFDRRRARDDTDDDG